LGDGPLQYAVVDINNDDLVDGVDFADALSYWGKCNDTNAVD